MDALALLSLQIAWGADEALENDPVSRLNRRPAEAAVGTHRPAAPAAAPPSSRPSSPSLSPSLSPWAAPSNPAPPPAETLPAIQPVPARGPVAEARDAARHAVDLDALRNAILAFDGCALRDTATRAVLATGPVLGGLAIVGEVPDEDEDRAGTPFAGRPGQLLDRMLASIGLDRAGVLLVPLIPWRPPGNRPPSTLELSVCLPFLERALELAAPAHLLLMGSRPSRAVADCAIRAGAGWRTPTLPGLPPHCRALAMRHPSYLLSHLPARRDAWTDLLRLRRVLDEQQGAGNLITGA